MITKAIVEEIISPYQVRVRIPLLDSPSFSTIATKTENLNIATICTLPNCYINLQVGDIVFVGFEDNTVYKAVVLGHLCREATTKTYASITLDGLNVEGQTKLSSDTTIGLLTPEKLSYLSDISDSLQKQINSLKEQIQSIQNKLLSETN